MTPVSRPLTGKHLTFDLSEQIAEIRKDEKFVETGRLGRTLVKDGALRLTMTVLATGAVVETHHAVSPMTLQVLEGRLAYRVDGEGFELREGEFLFFGPGHAQDIRALEDTVLLLTITGGEGTTPAETIEQLVAPAGAWHTYVILRFRTQVSGGRTAIETIVPMKEGDAWKVDGYFVGPE